MLSLGFNREKDMTRRFESRKGFWLVVWGLVVLLGAVLVGLAFYADSYQGDQIPCMFLFQIGPCYYHPYAGHALPLVSAGLLAILWGSAYVITILGLNA